jgi:hypothetical protein
MKKLGQLLAAAALAVGASAGAALAGGLIYDSVKKNEDR